MKLALRKTAPTGSNIWQRLSCWAIRARLVSQYCHAGVVIDGFLYHATASNGLHVLSPSQWNQENWELVDLNLDESVALKMWEKNKGAAYDWLSLLAFVGLRVYKTNRLYCFEWCWLAMTGESPKVRITPEMLFCAKINADKQRL